MLQIDFHLSASQHLCLSICVCCCLSLSVFQLQGKSRGVKTVYWYPQRKDNTEFVGAARNMVVKTFSGNLGGGEVEKPSSGYWGNTDYASQHIALGLQ